MWSENFNCTESFSRLAIHDAKVVMACGRLVVMIAT